MDILFTKWGDHEMILKNQKGLTLVELLATLTILSIVGVIIWSIFIQGTNYSNQAMTKNQMQQEANMIGTDLKRTHRTTNSYELTSTSCTVTIKTNVETKYEHPNLCYKIDEIETKETFNPRSDGQHSLSLTVTVYEKNNPSNTISIKTNLYRLKER